MTTEVSSGNHIVWNPVWIIGDENLGSVNLVSGGSGTEIDPYVIEGWEIVALWGSMGGQYGLKLTDTRSFLVIRDLYVNGTSAPFNTGIWMVNCSNIIVENSVFSDTYVAFSIRECSNITFAGNSLGVYQAVLVAGNSSSLTIEANTVTSDLDSRPLSISISGNGADPISISENDLRGGGIECSYCPDAVVTGNSGTGAISLEYCPGAVVSGNSQVEATDLWCCNASMVLSNSYGGTGYVYVAWSDDSEIMSNDPSSIWLEWCNETTLDSNRVNSSSSQGLDILNCKNLTLNGNIFASGGIKISGLDSTYYDGHVIGTGNTVNGMPILYLAHTSDVEISNESIGQLIMANISHALISDLTIDSTLNAIAVAGCSDVKIDRCHLTGNGVGISVVDSTNTLVRDCKISWSNSGVDLLSVTKCDICHNMLAENNIGIKAQGFLDSVIVSNNLSWNRNYGVYLEYGNGSVAYHNNFIHSLAWSFGGMSWNASYPIGGNYWSDGSTEDINGTEAQNVSGPDGICDEPYYVISGIVEDYLPIVRPIGDSIPIAAVSGDMVGLVGEEILLDSSGSFDAEDGLSELMVRWDLGGDGSWDTTWATEKTRSFQFSRVGNYTIILEVRDTLGLTNQTSVLIQIEEPDESDSWTASLLVVGIASACIVVLAIYLVFRKKGPKVASVPSSPEE